MTDQTTKPTQMRLHSCVLALHKWAKIQENYHKTLADPSKPVVLQTTPPSELKTSSKTRKFGITRTYLGNIGLQLLLSLWMLKVLLI